MKSNLLKTGIKDSFMFYFRSLNEKRLFRQWAGADRPFPPPERIKHLIQAERIAEYDKWLKTGKPIPAPHLVKQEIVKHYAETYRPNILIETGTFRGEMVDACTTLFRRIYSIELSKELSQEAVDRFSNQKQISIIQGDSGNILPEILLKIDEPCLFWLDGHYSGGVTAKGNKETPILQELMAILNHHIDHHIILIDDARCFNGQNDYPTIKELKDMVLSYRPDWFFEVDYDVIRTAARNIPPSR
ncbi:MAG: hypothetical protein AB2L12_10135 [Smithellaceae bacterium]